MYIPWPCHGQATGIPCAADAQPTDSLSASNPHGQRIPSGSPWTAYDQGMGMGSQRAAHRNPTGSPWTSDWQPMGIPRTVHAHPMGIPRAAHGQSMDVLRAAHGYSMHSPWESHGKAMDWP